MAHLQFMPGDPRLVDQLVYELKSKGIFDQFRKDCISDVDTRPAYQNLRQRVETSVSQFLSRQTWKPDLNKNQLREKLRKHILDGNYLEQGVERIVDQVVNPKVASVFIPQVEDLVYNYLGIARKKSATETSNDKGHGSTDLLPTDLEAVSPGSVKSDKDDAKEEPKDDAMDVDDDKPKEININDISMPSDVEPEKEADTQLSGISDLTSHDSEASLGKLSIPMPAEEINLENIPSPENSPPKIDLDSIELPKEEPIELKDIPLPDESPKEEKDQYFKPINSEDDSSSDSSIIRNMSPLTPIRNYNNENSCDAQQAFEIDADSKSEVKQEPNTFRFTIDSKSPENSTDVKDVKPVKDETNLAYQFNEQVNINTFNTPLYDDSSNSHNLQIDYESDANSKTNLDKIPFPDDPTSEDSKKESTDERKSHKSSHRSRDSHRHSSSKDRKSDSKHSSSRDRKDSKQDKKSSKDDPSKPKSSSDKSKDRSDKKESKDKDRDKHRSSHKSSSSSKDSKHRSSSSSQKHSSKHDDKDRKSSSSGSKDKEKSDKSSKDHRSSKDSKSSASRSDRDKKSRKDDKDKDKKDKKDTDDHYSASGRGNHTRRSTDRDSNDGSSSSKGSHNPPSTKSSETKTTKGSSSKSDNTSPSSESTSPTEKDNVVKNSNHEAILNQPKPIVRVETHLEMPMAAPPRLPFVPDVTLKKPRFAANLAEAKRLMKMRKFLDEEQKRMNQEAALLLEFQANVRPSLSQVYSNISGPELEFACISNAVEPANPIIETNYAEVKPIEDMEYAPDSIEMQLSEMNQETIKVDKTKVKTEKKVEEEITTTNKELVETEVTTTNKEVVETEVKTTNKEVVETEAKTTNKEVVETEVTTTNELKAEVVYESIEYNQPDFEDTEKILNEISKKVYGIIDEDENEDKPQFKKEEVTEDIKHEPTEFEVIIITEEIDDDSNAQDVYMSTEDEIKTEIKKEDRPFKYFAEHEKFSAELERDKFEKFLKVYMTDIVTDKLFLINCDSYEESIIKEVANTFGNYEIINYHKNGHCNKNIVKNVNVSNETVLPLERNTPIQDTIRSTPITPVFSPIKSECSFELSSDYDAKLEEMVNKTSRQEIMEIILGGVAPEESPSKLPRINYCVEENIEKSDDLKRKLSMESLNNNGHVLVPKIRKLSEDQISSTTEESPGLNSSRNNVRSKYLGKARRVGLSRPRKPLHPNSPSSDKSVENYDTNESPPNGKIKRQPHVRYDTSDLYKPKLHYLSRRNNIS